MAASRTTVTVDITEPTAIISPDVNWVEDVCGMNLVEVAQQNNKLYAVGGYTILRSPTNSSGGGTALANSHLYALDFSSSVDLQKDYASIFTSVTRLPDLVPRIIWGNFLWRDNSLNLFGGSQTTFPILLSDGSYSQSDRVKIGDALFSTDISNTNTNWKRNRPFDYEGTRKTPIGQAAKAFDGDGDNGQGVLWFYGGGYWESPVTVGTEEKGNTVDLKQYSDLWRVPGECDPGDVVACKQTTSTSSSAMNVTRPRMQSTMVWVDHDGNGKNAKGLLVLFGGYINGGDVVSMRNVHVYDAASATWYVQPTTADNDLFPPDRTEACAVVGTATDKSSYNIYVHGGVTNGTLDGGLWILTLPSFHWIHSDIGTENARAGHTCSKVHEAFMIVYRGIPNLGDAKCDQYAGIKIVDLETLEWVTKMDVTTNMVYKVPAKVYKAIGGSGTGGAIYNSPQNGFVDAKLYDIFNVPPSSPFKTTPPSSATSSSSTSSRVPKIAGGILGALVILIIILSLILWFLRRRRKQAGPSELPAQTADGNPAEMAAREPAVAELPGHHGQDVRVLGSQGGGGYYDPKSGPRE